jgi:hypothetical protein
MDAQYVEAWLTCPITLELMEDPVILSSGHTYDRKALVQSLLHKPRLDPKSGTYARERLTYAPNYIARDLLHDMGAYVPYDDSLFQRVQQAKERENEFVRMVFYLLFVAFFFLMKSASSWAIDYFAHFVLVNDDTCSVISALIMTLNLALAVKPPHFY